MDVCFKIWVPSQYWYSYFFLNIFNIRELRQRFKIIYFFMGPWDPRAKQQEFNGASLRSEEFLNNFTHQVWGQSHQLLNCNPWKLLNQSDARKR